MAKLLNEYDYASIHAAAGDLIKNRKTLKKSAIDRYMNYFETKCQGSKAGGSAADRYHADTGRI